MTLLVLELKIPSSQNLSTYGTWQVLIDLIPGFIGFTVSFLVTALYWRAHLSIARLTKTYDNRLLWYTIGLLFFVVLMPFSTAFYSNNFNYNGPFLVYCANLVFIGLFNVIILHYIIRKEGYSESFTPAMAEVLRFRSITAPVVWTISGFWVFVEPYSARFLFLSIFLLIAIKERRMKKKLQQAEAADH